MNKHFVSKLSNHSLGSGIGAAICAITANDARQALRKGEIQKSSFYHQHTKIP
jgi:hypothetical protein